MTGEEFAQFLSQSGCSNQRMAEILGVSRNTITRHLKQGTPLTVDWACAAIAADLSPWSKDASPAFKARLLGDDKRVVETSKLHKLKASIDALLDESDE